MITSDQMVSIIKVRSLQVIPVEVDGSVKWLAKTVNGTRAGIRHDPYSTPEEAVEAAELALSAADDRTQEEKLSVIISALQRGDYYIKPSIVNTPNPPGPPIRRVFFSVFNLNGSPTQIVDRSTFIQAVVDMEKLIV